MGWARLRNLDDRVEPQFVYVTAEDLWAANQCRNNRPVGGLELVALVLYAAANMEEIRPCSAITVSDQDGSYTIGNTVS
jgi:hypothetical protein